MRDFPRDEKYSFDQYDRVHVALATAATDDQIAVLKSNRRLISKLVSLSLVNIGFVPFMGQCMMQRTTKRAEMQVKRKTIDIREKASQLAVEFMTVCTVMKVRPTVCHQKSFLS